MNKPKTFIAVYFKDFQSAFKYAGEQNSKRGRKVFDIIKSRKGYFVVSKSVLKNCFGK